MIKTFAYTCARKHLLLFYVEIFFYTWSCADVRHGDNVVVDKEINTSSQALLQARAVDHLHVNGHLATMVVHDEGTDAAAARLKGVGQAGPEVRLVNDGEALLDITGLGHGNKASILEVEHAVLLEDRAAHGLHNNAGGRVGDERGLLVELLGEEVNTEVAVLASGSGGGDADDLARSALEDEDVSVSDVVAGNGNSVGNVVIITTAGAASTAALTDLGHLDGLTALRVQDAVSHLVNSVAERVVVAVLVVVTHVLLGLAGRLDGLLYDLGVLVVRRTHAWRVNGFTGDLVGVLVDGAVAGRVDGAVDVDFLSVGRLDTRTVFTFDHVNWGVVVSVVVSVNLNTSLCVGVRSAVFTVVV